MTGDLAESPRNSSLKHKSQLLVCNPARCDEVFNLMCRVIVTKIPLNPIRSYHYKQF
jgi:hypothetical protein